MLRERERESRDIYIRQEERKYRHVYSIARYYIGERDLKYRENERRDIQSME